MRYNLTAPFWLGLAIRSYFSTYPLILFLATTRTYIITSLTMRNNRTEMIQTTFPCAVILPHHFGSIWQYVSTFLRIIMVSTIHLIFIATKSTHMISVTLQSNVLCVTVGSSCSGLLPAAAAPPAPTTGDDACACSTNDRHVIIISNVLMRGCLLVTFVPFGFKPSTSRTLVSICTLWKNFVYFSAIRCCHGALH